MQLIKRLPGLIVVALLAGLAVALASLSSYVGAATVALLLGIIAGNTTLRTDSFAPGFSFTEKYILEGAIVLIGFGLNASVFAKLGWSTWVFIGLSVLLVLAVALVIAQLFGLSRKMGLLLGAGSAICGSAAIAAVSPLVKSNDEETGLSIGIINLMSTIGLLFLPILAGVLAFSTEHSALIIGGVIQSMGHVVGAGFSMNDEVGLAATVVKMGRVVLLIPLVVLLFFTGRQKTAGSGKMGFPLFVPLFVGALILAQLPFFPAEWSASLAKIGDILLVAAMVAIGFKIKLRSLFKIAGSSLAVGGLVFAFQIALYLGYIMLIG